MQPKSMCLDPHLNLGWGWRCEIGLSPPVKYFNWPFQGGTSFVDHLCYLCLVIVMLLHLFIAALWSPAGKGLTSWLLFVMFIMVLLLSHGVSWVRWGTWLYRFLIFAIFLTFTILTFSLKCHLCNKIIKKKIPARSDFSIIKLVLG